jgi:hypothetical protein
MEFLKVLRDQWDRAAAVAAGLIGVAALMLGWLRTSDALYPAQQLPYLLSGGLGGLFLLGITATAWLSADLRDEWRKLDGMEQEMAELNSQLKRLETAAPGARPIRLVDDRPVPVGRPDSSLGS